MRIVSRIKMAADNVGNVAISSDGMKVAYADGRKIYVVDSFTSEALQTYDASAHHAYLWFEDDNSLIASTDGKLQRLSGGKATVFKDVVREKYQLGALRGRWLVHNTPDDKWLLIDLKGEQPSRVVTDKFGYVGIGGTEQAPVVYVFGAHGLLASNGKTLPLPAGYAWPSTLLSEQPAVWQQGDRVYAVTQTYVFVSDGQSLKMLPRRIEASATRAPMPNGAQLLSGLSKTSGIALYDMDSFFEPVGDGVNDRDTPAKQLMRWELKSVKPPRLEFIDGHVWLMQREGIGARIVDLQSGEDRLPQKRLPPPYNSDWNQPIVVSPHGRYALVFAARSERFGKQYEGANWWLVDLQKRTWTEWLKGSSTGRYAPQPVFNEAETQIAMGASFAQPNGAPDREEFGVYDVSSQRLVTDLKSGYTYCAFNGDGSRLLCSGGVSDKSALFDTTSGKSWPTEGACFSRDGRYVVGRGPAFDDAVIPYDVRDGKRQEIAEAEMNRPAMQGERCAQPERYGVATKKGFGQAFNQEVYACQRTTSRPGSSTYSSDGKTLLIACDKHLVLLDAATGAVKARQTSPHDGAGLTARFSPDGRYVVSQGDDGSTRLWQPDSLKPIASVLATGLDYLVVVNGGFYMSSSGANRMVAFALGSHAFPFEQFDLQLNRPDIVLNALSAPADTVALYKRAYDKRLQRLKLTQAGDLAFLPELQLLNADMKGDAVELRLKAKAAEGAIKSLRIYVNGVGVSEQPYAESVTVPLSAGANQVAVSVVDLAGRESVRASTTLLSHRVAHPSLYVLAVGVSAYSKHELDLAFAAKDARDLAAEMERVNATLPAQYKARYNEWQRQKYVHPFERVHTKVLTDGEVTRENVLREKAFLQQAGVDDEVILFFAGHGLLDDQDGYWFATHDIDPQSPAARGLSFLELEGLLDGLTARKKIALLDTCHSGVVDRDEENRLKQLPAGVTMTRGLQRKTQGVGASSQAVSRYIGELFADLRRGVGATILTSSSGVQLSLESSTLKNGVFTASVLEAMRSEEADGDDSGMVHVNELRDFVSMRVGELTNGLQTPSLRGENFDQSMPMFPKAWPVLEQPGQSETKAKKKKKAK